MSPIISHLATRCELSWKMYGCSLQTIELSSYLTYCAG